MLCPVGPPVPRTKRLPVQWLVWSNNNALQINPKHGLNLVPRVLSLPAAPRVLSRNRERTLGTRLAWASQLCGDVRIDSRPKWPRKATENRILLQDNSGRFLPSFFSSHFTPNDGKCKLDFCVSMSSCVALSDCSYDSLLFHYPY